MTNDGFFEDAVFKSKLNENIKHIQLFSYKKLVMTEIHL